MLTKQSDFDPDVLSPHDQSSANKRHSSPHRGVSSFRWWTVTVATGMAFSYPRFNRETDAMRHIRSFLNVWNANHIAQRFPDVEAHASKIAEFGLTLDGRATCWHSQMDLAAITTFDQLQSAFLHFFHQRVPQCEIIRQFYTIKQLPTKSVADFSLCF